MERRGQETREEGCRLEEEEGEGRWDNEREGRWDNEREGRWDNEREGRWDNEREGRQETRKGICRLEKEGDRSREKGKKGEGRRTEKTGRRQE